MKRFVSSQLSAGVADRRSLHCVRDDKGGGRSFDSNQMLVERTADPSTSAGMTNLACELATHHLARFSHRNPEQLRGGLIFLSGKCNKSGSDLFLDGAFPARVGHPMFCGAIYRPNSSADETVGYEFANQEGGYTAKKDEGHAYPRLAVDLRNEIRGGNVDGHSCGNRQAAAHPTGKEINHQHPRQRGRGYDHGRA